MRKSIRFGLKKKILLFLIPLLACSFTISAYISLLSSRQSLFTVSGEFMNYKMQQLLNYSKSQWTNLRTSGFKDDPLYIDIVHKSIESFAEGTIRKSTEYIFAVDKNGHLVFTTGEINYNEKEGVKLNKGSLHQKNILHDFTISGKKYIGITANIQEFGWDMFLVEEKKSFLKDIVKMTYIQVLLFTVSLAIIIVAVLVVLGIMLGPIDRIRNAIHDISVHKNFSRKVKIEYPDEIGELAYEFNEMTSNLDLAYKKLKKYALDKAIASKNVFLREYETLTVLAHASEYKDPETGAHISRVSSYSLLLSKALGHSNEMQELIYYAAPLHDIGKLGIPDVILLKQDKLTSQEFEIIKTHTTIGHRILTNSSSKYLKAGAVISRSHHEKYDGTGYPDSLRGEEIPILGRIVSIADVFDALTSKRPYKSPWSFERALDYLFDKKGEHFDPYIIELFLNNISEIRRVFESIRE